MNLLINSFEQSLLLLPLVLGLYLSYGCAKLTDLTVEGSFVLGACTYAVTLTQTHSSIVSILCALCTGILSGGLTSLMQYKNRLNSLMAGIVSLFILQSVNVLVLGRPNINLLMEPHIFSQKYALIFLGFFLVILFQGIERSPIGLKIKAFGSNPQLFGELFSKERYRFLILSLSNMLAALSGVLMASVNGYADLYMGQGVALIGLGTFILGRVFGNSSSTSLLGLMIYFGITHSLLYYGVDILVMKILLGVFLATILGGSYVKTRV